MNYLLVEALAPFLDEEFAAAPSELLRDELEADSAEARLVVVVLPEGDTV